MCDKVMPSLYDMWQIKDDPLNLLVMQRFTQLFFSHEKL